MEDTRTLKWRHNTTNRDYGFENTLEQPVQENPIYASRNLAEEAYPYKYTVAGNHHNH